MCLQSNVVGFSIWLSLGELNCILIQRYITYLEHFILGFIGLSCKFITHLRRLSCVFQPLAAWPSSYQSSYYCKKTTAKSLSWTHRLFDSSPFMAAVGAADGGWALLVNLLLQLKVRSNLNTSHALHVLTAGSLLRYRAAVSLGKHKQKKWHHIKSNKE